MTFAKRAVRATVALLPLLLLPLTACDDPFGPRVWSAEPDTAQIWSASRPELIGMPSAYDFTTDPTRSVLIEGAGSTQGWDVALIDVNGQLMLAPASYFPGQGTRAAIAPRGAGTLASIERAPADSASYTRSPVALRVGDVYVIRSRINTCETGYGAGTRYAKITPVEIDQQEGTVRFALVRNPYCDDRSLIPPEDDKD